MQSLNNCKILPFERTSKILYNIAVYLHALPQDVGIRYSISGWNVLLSHFDQFFRKLLSHLPECRDAETLLEIMIYILKTPGIQQYKVINKNPFQPLAIVKNLPTSFIIFFRAFWNRFPNFWVISFKTLCLNWKL